MKSLSFVFLFYPVTFFAMHSTENRQELYEMQERECMGRTMTALFNEAFYEGSVVSAQAYDLMAQAVHDDSEVVRTNNPHVLKRLRDMHVLETDRRFSREKLSIWKSYIESNK